MEDNDFTNRIKVFSHVNVDSTIDELPGEKRSVDIFQHFEISCWKELLNGQMNGQAQRAF